MRALLFADSGLSGGSSSRPRENRRASKTPPAIDHRLTKHASRPRRSSRRASRSFSPRRAQSARARFGGSSPAPPSTGRSLHASTVARRSAPVHRPRVERYTAQLMDAAREDAFLSPFPRARSRSAVCGERIFSEGIRGKTVPFHAHGTVRRWPAAGIPASPMPDRREMIDRGRLLDLRPQVDSAKSQADAPYFQPSERCRGRS
jgi:hypothetical protein